MGSKKSGSSRSLLRSKTCYLLPRIQSRHPCDSQLLRCFGAVKLAQTKGGEGRDAGSASAKAKATGTSKEKPGSVAQYRFENNGVPHVLESLVGVLKFHAPDVSFNRIRIEWEPKSGCQSMRSGDPSKSRPTLVVCSSAGAKPGKIEGGTLEL